MGEILEMPSDGLVKIISQINHVIHTKLIVVDNVVLYLNVNSVLRLVAQLNQIPRFTESIHMEILEELII